MIVNFFFVIIGFFYCFFCCYWLDKVIFFVLMDFGWNVLCIIFCNLFEYRVREIFKLIFNGIICFFGVMWNMCFCWDVIVCNLCKCILELIFIVKIEIFFCLSFLYFFLVLFFVLNIVCVRLELKKNLFLLFFFW